MIPSLTTSALSLEPGTSIIVNGEKYAVVSSEDAPDEFFVPSVFSIKPVPVVKTIWSVPHIENDKYERLHGPHNGMSYPSNSRRGRR